MTLYKLSVLILAVGTLVINQVVAPSEAKLLRRSRYYDDYNSSPYDTPYNGGAAMPTGERAIITVRGARNTYDGSAPSRIAIEDQPFRGPLPRGVYDRMPMYPRSSDGYGYSGYNSGYGSRFGGTKQATRRRDFLDPDFGVKTSLRLANKRSRCNLDSDLDSEIPELGLDSAHLNIDCNINPERVADAAFKAARKVNDYRRAKYRPSSTKHKETNINIDYRQVGDDDDGHNSEDDDNDESDSNQSIASQPDEGVDDDRLDIII